MAILVQIITIFSTNVNSFLSEKIRTGLTFSRRIISIGLDFVSCGRCADNITFSSVMLKSDSAQAVCK